MQKDPFSLPRIDQVVDSTTGCSLLNFLDCYLGYHQIPHKEEDQIKTSFITPFGAFCYTTMSFIDDVFVTTQEDEGLISKLTETFDNLRKFKMKLNTKKCTFNVSSGKLLGYIVSHHGINPNPEKVSAIMKIKPPESLHDVQKLTGCMTALSRFISRLSVRGLPFFKLLQKHDNFQWP
jgi:hypothetical protein